MKVPISGVIATKDRSAKLTNLFASLRVQEVTLAEIVVVDASSDEKTRELCTVAEGVADRCSHRCAEEVGAASQRNQGVAVATQPFILFVDDDVVLEPGCLRAVWDAISGDPALGGVNAVITNQEYHAPGRVSGAFYAWLNGGRLPSYAGRCIGPGLNFLPDHRNYPPEVSSVDWLNSTCTVYRREALPDPPFHPHFIGYSLGEDLALSLVVARKWRLATVPGSRVFHDTGAGRRSLGAARGAAMELVNRHFIMTEIRGMRRFCDYVKLVAWELFSIASTLRSPGGWTRLPAVLIGKIRGIVEVLGSKFWGRGGN